MVGSGEPHFGCATEEGVGGAAILNASVLKRGAAVNVSVRLQTRPSVVPKLVLALKGWKREIDPTTSHARKREEEEEERAMGSVRVS